MNLRPQRKNANKHSEHGLRLLEKSLQRDGWIDAQTIAADGEMISGSARLEVAGEKFADVEPIIVESDGTRPVIVKRTDIPNADDPRARRLSVAANQIAATDWNPDGELLKEWGNEDKDIKAMFADSEWEEVTGEDKPTKDAEPQIDRAAELLEKWQVKTGDLWQIGEHRLICGDCTDPAVVARVGCDVDLWIVDPPYGIDWQGSNASTLEWEGIEGDKDLIVAKSIIEQLPQEQSAVIFGANCFPELLPHRGRWLCWDKRITEEADKMLGSAFELAWQNKISGFDVMFRVLHGGVVNSDGGKRYHPTQKPVDLYKKIIEYYKANTVYDSCAGAGTTLLACQNLGRRGRAVEISPAYCAVTLERMAQAFPGIEIKRLE